MKMNDIIKSLGGVLNINAAIPDNVSDEGLQGYLNTDLELVDGRLPVTVADVRAQEAWIAGHKPTPPATCSPWQIRKALNAQGLREAVEAAVASSEDQAMKDGWEFATEFRADDAFVLGMGAALGKTEAETYALIEFASTL